MRLKTLLCNLALAAILAMTALQPARADEGMWTYDNFPAALVKQRYGVDITPAWLTQQRMATVRLTNCTGAFASPDGLFLTNHHCIAACLAQLSSAQTDYLRNGFAAQTRADELRCQTQRADVLMKIEDITAQISAATVGKDAKSANEARMQARTRLEQACEKAAGTTDPRRCESVVLYGGGQYFLHQYRRYDDVRMVFAPEAAIAAFGGDPDNFQFPRWCLDMAVLRAYDRNGKPAATPGYLKINWNGPAAGDTTFISGHPGTTQRLLTVAQLEAQRAQLPLALQRNSELRGRYIQFGEGGEEQTRIVADELRTLENRIKVRRKRVDTLVDSAFMAHKQAAENELRTRANFAAGNDPWKDIERAAARDTELSVLHAFLEDAEGFNSALFRYARTLVRGAAERTRPSEQRLREYVDTALPRVVQTLNANVPVYAERESLTLSMGLMRMREFLGPDHPLVRNLLAELSPQELAAGLIAQTKLADPQFRKQLWEGGQAAIDASTDPMIRIAVLVDPYARAVRKQHEDEVEAITTAATGRIAAARFAAYGTTVYPDATFTLRINFGSVQGWTEAGEQVAPFTTLARAFERATGADPFRLPESWLARRSSLDLGTSFNYVTNNDIVGGNSGSAVVNAKGEIVGLAFDGNIHSNSGAYWFDTAKNRMVAVNTTIIRTALTQVYDMPALAKELGL
jgi:hypothetical protein